MSFADKGIKQSGRTKDGKTTIRDKNTANGLRIGETEIDILCIDQKAAGGY